MILNASIRDDDGGGEVGQCFEGDVVEISYVIFNV